MSSDNASQAIEDPPESASDNKQPSVPRRRGRAPVALPEGYQAIHSGYVDLLANTPLDADTRRAYASRVRGYLLWLSGSGIAPELLDELASRDGAARDYRTYLQTVARRKPTTINTTLAAIADFYTRTGRGTPHLHRLELPQQVPRALDTKTSTQWLRSVERWLNPRDRVLALLPFYAGLRLGETVALDVTDVQLSARKGTIIIRSGKGNRYREIPTHPTLRDNLAVWINDERPPWPGAAANPALLLNRRGGRLSARAAAQILGAIADDANIDEFTPHVLRHILSA
ncbi:MAG: integrase [Pseudonocardiales bacterium]|nr:MAG: integrase [Pseudonocardiales bacterium]